MTYNPLDGGPGMRVKVRFFAQVRELAGVREMLLELPEGATVSQGLLKLREAFPKLPLDSGRVAVAVNRSYVQEEHVLSEGDELALIPPVSGGQA